MDTGNINLGTFHDKEEYEQSWRYVLFKKVHQYGPMDLVDGDKSWTNINLE